VLGRLIDSLDDPKVAMALLTSLDRSDLDGRLKSASATAGVPPSVMMASIVRGFIETASDDAFVQLVGIMTRAEDPGLDAICAILASALPKVAA
jgi:hypothetical protein